LGRDDEAHMHAAIEGWRESSWFHERGHNEFAGRKARPCRWRNRPG
jgi:hypothetical protein